MSAPSTEYAVSGTVTLEYLNKQPYANSLLLPELPLTLYLVLWVASGGSIMARLLLSILRCSISASNLAARRETSAYDGDTSVRSYLLIDTSILKCP